MEKQSPNIWLFSSRNFQLIAFALLVLFEASRLLAASKLLNEWCGNGTAPNCYGNVCTDIIYTPSCSQLFGGLGMKIFLLLFIAYWIIFVIYRIAKKSFKGAALPAAATVIIFYVVDWIVRVPSIISVLR